MEGVGAFVGEEWESLNRMISIEDNSDHDLMLHLMNGNNDEIPSILWDDQNVGGVNNDQCLYFPSNFTDFLDSNFSQESSNNSSENNGNYHQDIINYGGNFVHHNDNTLMNQFCNNDNFSAPVFHDHDHMVMEEIQQLKAELYNNDEQMSSGVDMQQLKRKCETVPDQANLSEIPKKRSRVTKEQGQKNKRKAAQSTKNKKNSIKNEEEEMVNAGTCSSEDDSQELINEGGSPSESKESLTLNSKGKTRANRGSATDPQSLYARRRREKINERLRILQNLVPNGTKVDISTMLEDAVHYVKFLQLQIKLLSSDDLWMYAPIAHNGMDMGLYQNIFSNLGPQSY